MKKGKTPVTEVAQSNPNAAMTMADESLTALATPSEPTHVIRLRDGLVGLVVVREHPDKATEPVSLVKEGSRVSLLETDLPEAERWLKIEYQDRVGYVSADLVDVEACHETV